MSRIKDTFNILKSSNKKAFIPYIMAGDPDLSSTYERMKILQECGADIIELGIPFSDPLADGPTIQMASERAMKKGVTLRKVLSFVKGYRHEFNIPIVIMSYYNPIFKLGDEQFIKLAADAGVDGFIIPDLTIEEASGFAKKSWEFDIDTIFLVAPTSTKDRIKMICDMSKGFVYYVSITGITGARLNLPDNFYHNMQTIREVTNLPVAVGFGISTPQEAQLVCKASDGVIVGSAIVKRFNDNPSTIKNYLLELSKAIKGE
ncbi:MAG: tryptophan synthase subunit alpha [Thermodesulfovibrionales bacterium]|nr:tryptophan synthase subunit alpha [Thermodesulfovibrionales bacterium]